LPQRKTKIPNRGFLFYNKDKETDMNILSIINLAFDIYGAVCLVILLLAVWPWHLAESEVVVMAKKFFWSLVLLSLAKVVWLYSIQYVVWHSNPGSRYLLPPYQSIWYFMSYGWQRFAKPEYVSLLTALFFWGLFLALQNLSRGRIFYQEEIYSAGIGLLLNPWPQNSLLIPLVLVAGILLGILRQIFGPKTLFLNQPTFISTRLFWPLGGIILIFIGKWLVAVLGLEPLKL
jgi:hypothetical protein